MIRALARFVAFASLGFAVLAPAPVIAHGNHNTATSVVCAPNPVVRGNSTTCTLRVDDVNQSQATQPAGTMELYRGSVAPANLIGSCTANAVPNQTASSCAVVYSPAAEGSETLIAHFVNVGTAQHQWRTSDGGGTASRGTTLLTINPAPPASLRVVQSPSGQPTTTTAGVAIQKASGGGITVEVLNTLGERITTGTGSTLAVTMAIQTNAGGGFLSGTLTVNAVAGVATFSTLSIDKAGIGYTLRATGAGVTGVTTAGFNITAAAPNRFAFAQQPTNTVAGQTIGGGTGVTVRVEDQFGNVVTTSTLPITVAILNNPAAGTLSGTPTRNAVAGVATFNDLSIDRAGVGYTLQAAGALTASTSNAFDIQAGTAAMLTYGTPPSNTIAGQIIGGGGGVTVRVEDTLGNLVTSSAASVTVALAANPGFATLQGTLTVAAAGGIATFSNLVIGTAANGYTMSAGAPGLAGSVSGTFDITPSAAVKLGFGQQPTNNEADTAIMPAITVRIEDVSGNLVSDNRTITLAIDSNPGGAVLQGTLSVAAVNGIATFSDIVIDVAAAGYTLLATTTGGLTPATSAAFTINPGVATQLQFLQQPTNVAAGALIAPAVTVRVLDTPGNLVTTSSASITVALASNPGPGSLGGTKTVAAVNGVATFSTLSVNVAANGYTLQASATALASATSNAFNVTVGAATALAYVQQPTNTVAGQAIAGMPGGISVRVVDASGNLVASSSAPVTMAIEFDAGGAGTTLFGTLTVNAVNGIATFANLSIQKAASGYTLRASSTGLTHTVSDAFDITFAPASKLAFGVHPSNTTAGGVIVPPVTVRVLDVFDNLVADSTAAIALSIGANPGGGILGGTATGNAVAGVATFNSLFINAAGNGYTLVSNSGGLTGAASNAFNITAGPAAMLAFVVQPVDTPLLANITPAVQVAVQDALGNTITGSSAPVSMVLAANPGGAALLGTTTVNASGGIATFNSLSLDQAANGYTIQANSSGLASAISVAFDVTAGAPAQLAFVQQPVNTAAGIVLTPWPSIQVEDAGGNPVAFSGNVTMAIGNNPAGGTLSGTLTVAAVGGVATFDTLSIDNEGVGYTLVASAAGLTPATSNAFDVADPGFTFDSLSPASGPSTGGTIVTITGSGFGAQIGRYQVVFGTANPAPPVTATRINNNTLTIETPAHPPGQVNVIVIDSFTGGTRALQNVYTYISSTPVKLRFGDQPTDIAAGTAFSPLVTVEILDTNDNVVNNATSAITISFWANLPGGTLLGTATVNAVNGVATFTDLSVDKVGTGYQLTATAPGLFDPSPSNAFAVTAGAATKVAFVQQPTNNDPGIPIAPAVTVQVQDAHGNVVTSSSATVDIAIGINAGAGNLTGGVSIAAVNGVATFNSLVIDKAGSGYTLIASSAGLTDDESATFDIAFGAPSLVRITTHPGNGTAGVALTPAIVARIEDGLGNVVTDSTAPVTVSISNNPGGSTLTGTVTVNAVNGIATFNNVSLDKVGAGYELEVTSFGLQSDFTNPFDITNGAAAGLSFLTHPGDTSQGAVITPSPEVRIVDAFGNAVPDATNAITIAIGVNPGGGVLAGTVTRNAVGGVALFNNLTINAGGDGYTLTANATGLTGATSLPFSIIAVGGGFNIFSSATPAGDIVGYLPTLLAGEDFCVDIVKINGDGTAEQNFTNVTLSLHMLDASVNTGSLQEGNCRSSWTMIQEWRGIAASPGDGGRITVCAGLQGTGGGVLNNLNEGDVWPNVRFRAFTTSGQSSTGCSSDAFAIRPDAFELASVTVTDDDWQTAGTLRDLILPGAATTSGGPVHAAGRPFRMQVTAVNSQGVPTGNYDGAPTVEVLARLLPSPCNGCGAPAISVTGWGQVAGVPGAVRTNQAIYDDAGSLSIRLVDDLFASIDQVDVDLGLQPPDAGSIASGAVDIGRFVPDSFVVSPTSVPVFHTQGITPMTCAGSRSFTYIGQAFGYATLPQATISGRSASGAVTTAYQGALWKLTPASVTQSYSANTVPAAAGTLDDSMAPLTPGNASLVSNDDGTGTLIVNTADRLLFEREPLIASGMPAQTEDPPETFEAFISLTLEASDSSEAAVTGNSAINTGTPGIFTNIAFDSGNEFRYGRMRLINSVGSEIEPLLIPYRLETWQDIGSGVFAWVTESDDNCSTFAIGDFTVGDIEATGSAGFTPTLDSIDATSALGIGALTIGPQAPGVTGSFTVTGTDIPSYLEYNWNSDTGGAELGPTAKAAFGVNQGNPRRIFRSQSFTPRGGN